MPTASAGPAPQASASTSARTTAKRPTLSSARPAQSILVPEPGSVDSGAAQAMIAAPPSAIGTLTQKIARQSISTRTPPASGPIASAIAETAAQIPSARACSVLSGKTLQTIASERVRIGAAPMPCTTRPATSISELSAKAERTEPAAKISIPIEEDALAAEHVAEPAGADDEDRDRQQVDVEDPLQLLREAPTSRWMTGSASATTVESSISRKSPAQAPASVHHLRDMRGNLAAAWDGAAARDGEGRSSAG